MAEEVRELAEQSARAAGDYPSHPADRSGSFFRGAGWRWYPQSRMVVAIVNHTGKMFYDITETIHSLTRGIVDIAEPVKNWSGAEEMGATTEEHRPGPADGRHGRMWLGADEVAAQMKRFQL